MVGLLVVIVLWAPRTASAAPDASPVQPSPQEVSGGTRPIECGPGLAARVEDARLDGLLWSGVAAAERCGAVPESPALERAEALRAAGQLRALIGDRPRAEADLKAALELAPEDAETLLRLAGVVRDRPEEALRYARRAALVPQFSARAERLGAEIAVDLGDAALARALLESALKADPDDLDALALMTRVLRDDRASASRYAARAAKTAARAPLWYRGEADRLAARAWLELDEGDEALAALRSALELDPDDLDALALAEQAVKTASSRKPPLAGIGPGRAPVEPRVSEKDAERRLELDPSDLDALRRLSDFARAAGKLDEAERYADRFTAEIADASAWRQVAAYRLMVRSWRALGEEDKARRCILRALELDWTSIASLKLFLDGFNHGRDPSRLAVGFLDVGSARARLGETAGAEAAFLAALKLTPDSADALERLAGIKLERGELKEALSDADRMLAAAKDERRVLERGMLLKAKIQVALGDSAGARESLSVVFSTDVARGRVEELERPRTAGALDDRSLADQIQAVLAELKAGRTADALSLADRLVARSTAMSAAARAEAYRQRAGARLAAGDARGAEADERAALALVPDDVATLAALVDVAKLSPKDSEALVDAHEARDSSRRPAWLVLRGATRALAGDDDGARQDFLNALALDAKAACHSGLFGAHRERVDPRLFELCGERFPKEASLFMDAGVARFRLLDIDGAAADFRKAAALRPDWDAPRQSLDALRDARR